MRPQTAVSAAARVRCCAMRCGVQVITVDSLNLMRARLLIFDIEGMELDAIQAISL